MAATSALQLQLQRLRQRPEHDEKLSNSFLFSNADAKQFSREQIHELAIEGMKGLINIDNRFDLFLPLLFDPTQIRRERATLTDVEASELDQQLIHFFTLLSPYLLLTPAHQAIEYLVRVYEVHSYHVQAVLRSFLPYHDHAIFAKILLLLDLRSTGGFNFLKENQLQGAPLPRQILVNACGENKNVLQLVCETMTFAIRYGCVNNAANALWVSVCTELTTHPEGESVFRVILPLLVSWITQDPSCFSPPSTTPKTTSLATSGKTIQSKQQKQHLAYIHRLPPSAITAVSSAALIVLCAWSAEVTLGVKTFSALCRCILSAMVVNRQSSSAAVPRRYLFSILSFLFATQPDCVQSDMVQAELAPLIAELPWQVLQHEMKFAPTSTSSSLFISASTKNDSSSYHQIVFSFLIQYLVRNLHLSNNCQLLNLLCKSEQLPRLRQGDLLLIIVGVAKYFLVQEKNLALQHKNATSSSAVSKSSNKKKKGSVPEPSTADEVGLSEQEKETQQLIIDCMKALERRYPILFDQVISELLGGGLSKENGDLMANLYFFGDEDQEGEEEGGNKKMKQQISNFLMKYISNAKYGLLDLSPVFKEGTASRRKNENEKVPMLPLATCFFHHLPAVRKMAMIHLTSSSPPGEHIKKDLDGIFDVSSTHGRRMIELLTHFCLYETELSVMTAAIPCVAKHLHAMFCHPLLLASVKEGMEAEEEGRFTLDASSSSSIAENLIIPSPKFTTDEITEINILLSDLLYAVYRMIMNALERVEFLKQQGAGSTTSNFSSSSGGWTSLLELLKQVILGILVPLLTLVGKSSTAGTTATTMLGMKGGKKKKQQSAAASKSAIERSPAVSPVMLPIGQNDGVLSPAVSSEVTYITTCLLAHLAPIVANGGKQRQKGGSKNKKQTNETEAEENEEGNVESISFLYDAVLELHTAFQLTLTDRNAQESEEEGEEMQSPMMQCCFYSSRETEGRENKNNLQLFKKLPTFFLHGAVQEKVALSAKRHWDEVCHRLKSRVNEKNSSSSAQGFHAQFSELLTLEVQLCLSATILSSSKGGEESCSSITKVIAFFREIIAEEQKRHQKFLFGAGSGEIGGKQQQKPLSVGKVVGRLTNNISPEEDALQIFTFLEGFHPFVAQQTFPISSMLLDTFHRLMAWVALRETIVISHHSPSNAGPLPSKSSKNKKHQEGQQTAGETFGSRMGKILQVCAEKKRNVVEEGDEVNKKHKFPVFQDDDPDACCLPHHCFSSWVKVYRQCELPLFPFQSLVEMTHDLTFLMSSSMNKNNTDITHLLDRKTTEEETEEIKEFCRAWLSNALPLVMSHIVWGQLDEKKALFSAWGDLTNVALSILSVFVPENQDAISDSDDEDSEGGKKKQLRKNPNSKVKQTKMTKQQQKGEGVKNVDHNVNLSELKEILSDVARRFVAQDVHLFLLPLFYQQEEQIRSNSGGVIKSNDDSSETFLQFHRHISQFNLSRFYALLLQYQQSSSHPLEELSLFIQSIIQTKLKRSQRDREMLGRKVPLRFGGETSSVSAMHGKGTFTFDDTTSSSSSSSTDDDENVHENGKGGSASQKNKNKGGRRKKRGGKAPQQQQQKSQSCFLPLLPTLLSPPPQGGGVAVHLRLIRAVLQHFIIPQFHNSSVSTNLIEEINATTQEEIVSGEPLTMMEYLQKGIEELQKEMNEMAFSTTKNPKASTQNPSSANTTNIIITGGKKGGISLDHVEFLHSVQKFMVLLLNKGVSTFNYSHSCISLWELIKSILAMLCSGLRLGRLEQKKLQSSVVVDDTTAVVLHCLAEQRVLILEQLLLFQPSSFSSKRGLSKKSATPSTDEAQFSFLATKREILSMLLLSSSGGTTEALPLLLTVLMELHQRENTSLQKDVHAFLIKEHQVLTLSRMKKLKTHADLGVTEEEGNENVKSSTKIFSLLEMSIQRIYTILQRREKYKDGKRMKDNGNEEVEGVESRKSKKANNNTTTRGKGNNNAALHFLDEVEGDESDDDKIKEIAPLLEMLSGVLTRSASSSSLTQADDGRNDSSLPSSDLFFLKPHLQEKMICSVKFILQDFIERCVSSPPSSNFVGVNSFGSFFQSASAIAMSALQLLQDFFICYKHQFSLEIEKEAKRRLISVGFLKGLFSSTSLETGEGKGSGPDKHKKVGKKRVKGETQTQEANQNEEKFLHPFDIFTLLGWEAVLPILYMPCSRWSCMKMETATKSKKKDASETTTATTVRNRTYLSIDQQSAVSFFQSQLLKLISSSLSSLVSYVCVIVDEGERKRLEETAEEEYVVAEQRAGGGVIGEFRQMKSNAMKLLLDVVARILHYAQSRRGGSQGEEIVSTASSSAMVEATTRRLKELLHLVMPLMVSSDPYPESKNKKSKILRKGEIFEASPHQKDSQLHIPILMLVMQMLTNQQQHVESEPPAMKASLQSTLEEEGDQLPPPEEKFPGDRRRQKLALSARRILQELISSFPLEDQIQYLMGFCRMLMTPDSITYELQEFQATSTLHALLNPKVIAFHRVELMVLMKDLIQGRGRDEGEASLSEEQEEEEEEDLEKEKQEGSGELSHFMEGFIATEMMSMMQAEEETGGKEGKKNIYLSLITNILEVNTFFTAELNSFLLRRSEEQCQGQEEGSEEGKKQKTMKKGEGELRLLVDQSSSMLRVLLLAIHTGSFALVLREVMKDPRKKVQLKGLAILLDRLGRERNQLEKLHQHHRKTQKEKSREMMTEGEHDDSVSSSMMLLLSPLCDLLSQEGNTLRAANARIYQLTVMGVEELFTVETLRFQLFVKIENEKRISDEKEEEEEVVDISKKEVHPLLHEKHSKKIIRRMLSHAQRLLQAGGQTATSSTSTKAPIFRCEELNYVLASILTCLATMGVSLGVDWTYPFANDLLQLICKTFQAANDPSLADVVTMKGEKKKVVAVLDTTPSSSSPVASQLRICVLLAIQKLLPLVWPMVDPYIPTLMVCVFHKFCHESGDFQCQKLTHQFLDQLHSLLEPSIVLQKCCAVLLPSKVCIQDGIPTGLGTEGGDVVTDLLAELSTEVNNTLEGEEDEDQEGGKKRMKKKKQKRQPHGGRGGGLFPETHSFTVIFAFISKVLQKLSKSVLRSQFPHCVVEGQLFSHSFELLLTESSSDSFFISSSQEDLLAVFRSFYHVFLKFKEKQCLSLLSRMEEWAFYKRPSPNYSSSTTAMTEDGADDDDDEEKQNSKRCFRHWIVYFSLLNFMVQKLGLVMEFALPSIISPAVECFLAFSPQLSRKALPFFAPAAVGGKASGIAAENKILLKYLSYLFEVIFSVIGRVAQALVVEDAKLAPAALHAALETRYFVRGEVFERMMPLFISQCGNKVAFQDTQSTYLEKANEVVIPCAQAFFKCLSSPKLWSRTQQEILKLLRSPSDPVRIVGLLLLKEIYNSGGEELVALIMAEALPAIVECTEDTSAEVVAAAKEVCDALSAITGSDILYALE